MTKDISQFKPEVYGNALSKLSIPGSDGSPLTISDPKRQNDSFLFTVEVPQSKDGHGYLEPDTDYVTELINELLAENTYTKGEDAEIEYWPVILNSKHEYQGLVSGRRTGSPACLLPVISQTSNGNRKLTYQVGPTDKALFLADDSDPYRGGEKANPIVYVDYYQLDSKENNKLSKLGIGLPAARGTATGSLGAGRCDSVDEVDYVWMGNKELGVALGLDPKNVTVWSLIKNTGQPVVGYLPALESKPTMNEFISGVIDLLKTKGFFLANFPENSEILYFKRFRQVERKNLPQAPSAPKFIPLRFKQEFYDAEFQFAARKKQKEKQIAINPNLRKSAATIMLDALEPFTNGVVFRFFKNHRSRKGSAKLFAQAIEIRLDFDQEWCHLLGHGDSGAEEPSNFISGSKHCNSEQLAIEEGQRIWSKSKGVSLQANITTYIEPILQSYNDRPLKKAVVSSLEKQEVPVEEVHIAKVLLTNKFFELNWLKDDLVALEGFGKRYNTLVNMKDLPEVNIEERERMQKFLDYYLIKKILDNVLKTILDPINNIVENDLTKIVKKVSTNKIAEAIVKKGLLRGYQTKNGASTLSFPEDFLVKYTTLKNEINGKDMSIPWKVILEFIEESYLKNFYPRYMRYKIKLKTGRSWVKVFDHVYGAQSESFNYHEFKILRTTVDRLIAEAIGDDPKKEYEKRIQKKSADYKIGPIRFYRDANGGIHVKEVHVVDPNAMDVENG